MKDIANVVFGILWVSGAVIASGFWSTLFAVILPFWAWYLIIERLMIMAGII